MLNTNENAAALLLLPVKEKNSKVCLGNMFAECISLVGISHGADKFRGYFSRLFPLCRHAVNISDGISRVYTTLQPISAPVISATNKKRKYICNCNKNCSILLQFFISQFSR